MKIPFLGLNRIQEQPLRPLYVISGDEPFQRDFAYLSLLTRFRAQQYEIERFYLEANLPAEHLESHQANLSLFGDRKVSVLNFRQVPDKQANQALDHLLQPRALHTEAAYLLCLPRLRPAIQKNAWFQSACEHGVVIQVWEPQSDQEIHQLIRFILHHYQVKADSDASAELMERTQGNLFAAAQFIEKLAYVCEQPYLDHKTLNHHMPDSAHYNVFDLAAAWLQADKRRLARVLDHLQRRKTELSLVLWALARECRLLLRLMQTPPNERQAFFREEKIFKGHQQRLLQGMKARTTPGLQTALRVFANLDERLKTHTDTAALWQTLGMHLLTEADAGNGR